MSVNSQKKYIAAGKMLDKMVSDYRDDMAKWDAQGNEHAEKWVDAQTIARHMTDLAHGQPEVTGWILTLAVQRLGERI